jgi:hypothetical protein
VAVRKAQVIALAFLLGSGLVAAIGAMAWLTYRGDKRNDRIIAESDVLAAARVELNKQTIRAERAEFELASTKDVLATSERVTDALAKELADAIEKTSLGTGLAAADVRSRVLRIAQAHRARVASSGVRADPGAPMPDEETTERTEPASLPVVAPDV